MPSLLLVAAGLLLLYFLQYPYNLGRNYLTARKTGLPIIIVPIDQNAFLWMVISVPLRPILKVSLLRCSSKRATTSPCSNLWHTR